MAELTSLGERKRTDANFRNEIKSVFPEIRAFLGVGLGGGSGPTISVYEGMEAADFGNFKSHQAYKGQRYKRYFS